MPRKRPVRHQRAQSSAARKWAEHKKCEHRWRTVVHERTRVEWLYCLKCNLFFVKELEADEGEQGA